MTWRLIPIHLQTEHPSNIFQLSSTQFFSVYSMASPNQSSSRNMFFFPTAVGPGSHLVVGSWFSPRWGSITNRPPVPGEPSLGLYYIGPVPRFALLAGPGVLPKVEKQITRKVPSIATVAFCKLYKTLKIILAKKESFLYMKWVCTRRNPLVVLLNMILIDIDIHTNTYKIWKNHRTFTLFRTYPCLERNVIGIRLFLSRANMRTRKS